MRKRNTATSVRIWWNSAITAVSCVWSAIPAAIVAWPVRIACSFARSARMCVLSVMWAATPVGSAKSV